MTTDTERIAATITRLVRWLVTGDYFAIEQYTGGVRLSNDELRRAVAEYGRKLVMPSISVFENIDAILVTNADPKRWSVRFDLWTDEGRSDLSLECTLIDDGNSLLRAEVDNLHVL